MYFYSKNTTSLVLLQQNYLTVFFLIFQDEIKITPFNLKEEQEEGEFATDGSFIWKKNKEVNDAWLDNVDWVKVKEVSAADKLKQDAADNAEDEAEAAYNEEESYRQMISFMKSGETVAKTIRRLGGSSGGGPGQQKIVIQKQRKIAQKLKKGQKLTEDEELFQKSRQDMNKMTGLADLILSRSGNMEIYDETFEKINFYLKEKEENKDDDVLDMFAKDLDEDKKEVTTEIEPVSSSSTEKPLDIHNEISWEFRWENKDDAEIHGPHTSEEMLKWSDNGFFDKGVFVRKIGSNEFLDGKRIDFDLYV